MTTGATILHAFYAADGQFVSADELRRALNVPAAQVSKEIAELIRHGYRIESHPLLGYRLLDVPDRLSADDIKARLITGIIGQEILIFEETASTNDIVTYLAVSGAREGVVVFAESQTKGRGRHGRTWASPRGKGLWFSVLLRPNLPANAMSRLTVAASVAVARALRQFTNLDARIKWPNDILIGERKVAGLLTELHTGAAVLGIGIDVNCMRADFPPEVAGLATSLLIETGNAVDRAALAAAVLHALDVSYRQALADFEPVIAEWAQWCRTLGRQISVKTGTRRVEGHAQALDGDGALLLRRDNGQIERILGADVIVERA
jgi:BirA family transcriptional regulator, biotin operon repressor / biotin---[acetyl-CoA-carboxylase] ligase